MKARTLAEIDQDAAASEIVPRLLDAKQIAGLLQVTTRHLRKLCHRGEFPKPILIGRRVRWPASDYNAYVAKLPRAVEPTRRSRPRA